MTEALHRVSELAGLGAGAADVSAVPANRLEALARDGLSAKAQAIDRREPKRKVATLVATVRSLASDALDVFGVLMATKLIKAAELVSRWAVVRPFLPLLAGAIPFGATPAGQPVMDAVAELPELIGRKKVRDSEIRQDLALLLVDVRLWPIVPVQFAAGWLLGWLRHKTDSFAPGAAAHTIANVAAGLIAA